MSERPQIFIGKIDKYLWRLSGFTTGIACVALVLMAFHVMLDVFMRYVFNSPLAGTAEIVSYYYMVAVVVFPVAYLERLDKHITVDLVYSQLPFWARRITFIFSCLMTALFFAIFTYSSSLSAIDAMSSREVIMGMSAIEIWPARFVLPLSFGLLVLAALLRSFSSLVSPAQVPRG